jgi:hypothetical protein
MAFPPIVAPEHSQPIPAPEVIVIVVGAVEIGAILFVGIVGNPHAFEPGWATAGASVMAHVLPATLLPLWAFVRFFDWLGGGPRRRLMARSAAWPQV